MVTHAESPDPRDLQLGRSNVTDTPELQAFDVLP